ncbi:MAG TPA: glycerol-3-phosphate dehydrogenase/oxidase [Gammaproteobacteria bacterium]|nr:glycerol-3-phosphate dehydrogenase/oxidase [Gammaproteobacteria bacterium]
MQPTTYDVLVIGGGIHGAGVAQAAAAAGYSVCLLEKTEIASGTSSKSSKLIHGGLRYLESGQFSLVRECLRERQYLLNNAPHLVKLVPFIIPIYQQTQRRPLVIRTGLSLYAILNGLKLSGLFKTIPQKKWSTLDGLSTNELQHVFQYQDAQTDDRQLTQAVIASAVSLGCKVIKPAEVKALRYQPKIWQVRYEQHQENHTLLAKTIVNAAGPWVNQVLKRVISKPSIKSIDLVQGTHIVLQGSTQQGIYYLESPIDQRAIFVMPWHGNTLVGTTEKIYQGDPGDVRPTEEEVNYLLENVKYYFAKYQQTQPEQILECFAGLRVLPSAEGLAFSRPRETRLFEDAQKAPGLFTIYGGKLTAYRATAELVVNQIVPLLPNVASRADTKTLRLPE